MTTFFMFGKYSSKSVKQISAKRSVEATKMISKFGGEFQSGYALLGKHDIILIIDFPNEEQALKASVALNQLLGISFETAPAVTMEKFDELMGEL